MPVACHHGHMHINSALCMADTGMHAVCRVPLQHAYHLASAWKVQMPGVVIHAYAGMQVCGMRMQKRTVIAATRWPTMDSIHSLSCPLDRITCSGDILKVSSDINYCI